MKIVTKSLLASLNRMAAAFVACTMAGLLTCAVFANPTLDHVAAGNVSVQQTPGTTVVNQASQKAIINWQSFNIGHGESTHFNQPAGGVALNRISAAQGASQIYGSLTATGQIILMNAAGVYFGPSAYVNVGGLVATTANISDQNFMNGLYQFSKVGGYSGAIVNEGQIIAAQHGLVALVAPGVVNKGMIQANLGKVILASGEAFTLNFSGDSLVNFAVTAKTTSPGIDKDGNPLPAGISNTGSIFANGGTIILSAQAVAGILDHMINMEGIAQTQSVYEDNGQIILSSDPDSGIVRVAANLDASGKGAGETGGNITITGHNILIDSPSSIDVSGDAGGGDVFVGGNYQGKGPLPNANATVMAPNAIIRADAITAGNGGTVILWADNVTKAYGSISAKGGRLGGDGGFIETSGKNYLDVNGISVSTLAANGKVGMWLLDPTDLTISTAVNSNVNQAGGIFTADSNSTTSNLQVSVLTSQLVNTDVTVQTTSGGSGGGSGDITVANTISWSSQYDLTLSAYRNILINGGVTVSNTTNSNAVLNLIANNEGAFALGSGNGTVTNSGTINMDGAVNVYYNPTSYAAPVTYTNTGAGAVTAFMYINSASELDLINDSSANWDKNYALSNNIDASSIANFTPIGDSSTNYTGNFNGRNFSISNLTINYPASSEPIGFIGINAGTIQNLSLTNADITGNDIVGILVGVNDGTIAGSSTTGSMSGFSNVGGLVGINNAIISNSSSSATVTGTGGNYIGGLIGKNVTGSSISNVFATGNVFGGDAYAIGGLIGSNEIDLNGSGHSIYYQTGTVNATSGAIGVGGLIGENYGVLSNFALTSPVNIFSNGGAQYIGGLVGYNSNNISNSFVNVNITGTGVKAGGLVGDHNGGTISASYTVGSIVSDNYAGGLVGQNASTITDSYSMATTNASSNGAGGLVGVNFATVDNSYSTGQVTSPWAGGLIAEDYGTVNNSYWDTDTTGTVNTSSGTGLSTAQMMTQANFSGWDFTTVWGVVATNNSYPYLRSFYSTAPRAISGTSPAAVNTTINLAVTGVVTSTTQVFGANGFYYFLTGNNLITGVNNTIGNSTNILTYIANGATVGSSVAATPAGAGSINGMNISASMVNVGSNNTSSFSQTNLSSAVGALVDPYILYSMSGSDITLGNATYQNIGFGTTIGTTYTIGGNLTPYSGGNATFNFAGPTLVSIVAGLTLNAGTGDVTFGSTLRSSGASRNLVINSTGTTTFNEIVGGGGGVNPLASLTTDAGGTTVINTTAITTNGASGMNFGDNTSINANLTLAAGAGAITFGGTLNSFDSTARTIALNSTGTTTLSGAVGNTFALSTLTTNASGTTAINGGAVTTTGAQTYNDAVTLGADTTLTSTASGAINFALASSTINGARLLTVNTAGTTTFVGAIGGTTPLTGIATGSGGTTAINSGTVDTSGGTNGQNYNDNVTLGAATTLNAGAGDVTFGGTLNSATSNRTLAINSTGTTTFNGIVGGGGGVTPLASLTTNAGGSTVVNANITSTGNQTYNDTFTFSGTRTLTTSGASGNISFAQPLSWVGSDTLSLNASGASGTITLPSSITATNGTLTLNAGDFDSSPNLVYNTYGTPTQLTTAINVNIFNMQSGRWIQIGSSLPAFSATDFRATGDRFVRALAGDGSIGSPYQITDIYGLQGIGSGSHTLASNFILANNINLAPAATWNSGAGWDPMGSTSVPFSESFNGNNYTLDNLTMSRLGQTDVGLFAESSNAASFSNLNMTNINISVGANSGALVGRGRGSFSNINLSGTITANGAFVGFLSGRYNSDTTETASNVTTSGTLTSSSTQVGGIFGSIRSNGGNFQMSNSSSSVNVTGTTDVGGLVGEFQGNGAVMTITSSHATGTVSGTTNVGGLVGRMQGNTINLNQNTVSNSYSTGNVTGTTNVGGLVGQMTAQATGSGSNAITNSYSNSAVTGTTRVGGLVGYATSASTVTTNDISGSYSNGSITTSGTGGSIGGLIGQADALSTIDNSYSNIASITNTTGADNVGGLLGANFGSVTDSYSITNITIANGSLNVGALIGINSGSVSDSYAAGNITNNTTTAGLTGRLGGLIGSNSGTITDSYATGSITSAYTGSVGGLVGENSGSIATSYSTGSVTASTGFFIGGLAGHNTGTGTINNSFSSSPVTGLSIGAVDSSSIGGLVGYNEGSVATSYATGSVTANAGKYVGGLVGNNPSGTIADSYSTGSVTGVSTTINGFDLGGLVGLIAGGSITNSYSTGTVSASAGYTSLGGLVGAATGGTITNSYWDTQSSGQSSSAGGTGLTTAQMQAQANFSGWDFATIWNIVEGQSYPFLRAFYSTAPRAISGSTPATAGTTVSFASNGTVLDSVSTSSNGSYYFLAGNNLISGVDSSIADGTAILAYLNSGSTVGNAVALAPVSNGSLSNFNISANNLTVGTTAASSMSNTSLATAVGALTSSTILYSALGNAITIGNNTYKNIAFNTTASTTYAVNGNINSTSGATGSSITFNAAPSVNTTATLSAVTISFINGLTGNGNLTITGANSSNTLSMKSAASQTFDITSANTGSASGIGSFIGAIAFNNIQNIVGGDNGNTFNFSNNATMAGTLNGSNLNSTNTINLNAYNAAIKVVLSSTNDGVVRTMSDNLITAFANITHVNPNASFGNTIYTPSGKGNNVYITGGRAGYINDPIYFTGVNSLIASSGGSVSFLANATFDAITGLYTVDGVTMSLSGFNSISGYTTTTSVDVSNIIQQPPTNAEQNVVTTNTSTSSWVLAGTSIDQNLTTMVTDINNEMDSDLQKVKINPYCYSTQ